MLIHCPRCQATRPFKTCLLGIRITPESSSHLCRCEICNTTVIVSVEVVSEVGGGYVRGMPTTRRKKADTCPDKPDQIPDSRPTDAARTYGERREKDAQS